MSETTFSSGFKVPLLLFSKTVRSVEKSRFSKNWSQLTGLPERNIGKLDEIILVSK